MRTGGRTKNFQRSRVLVEDNVTTFHQRIFSSSYLLDHGLESFGIIRRLAAHLVIAGLGKLFGYKGSYLNRIMVKIKKASRRSSTIKRAYDASPMCLGLFLNLDLGNTLSTSLNVMNCTLPSATNSSLYKSLPISYSTISLPFTTVEKCVLMCLCGWTSKTCTQYQVTQSC